MNFDFYGIKEVMWEFEIPESEIKRLALLLGQDFVDLDDYLKDDTSYIVFDAYNYNDRYLRLCRIGALKCLEMQNKGYSESRSHWIDFDKFEKELKDDFYEFTFTDDYGHEETIFIYPIDI